MRNKASLKFIKFRDSNQLKPSGTIAIHGKVAKAIVKSALFNKYGFKFVTDFFSIHSSNHFHSKPDFKKDLILELDKTAEMYDFMLDWDQDISESKSEKIKKNIKQLHLLLRQIIISDKNAYIRYRSFFLEVITLHFIQKKHVMPKRNIFHEPIICVGKKPFLKSTARGGGKYRVGEIKVDFAFKKAEESGGLFLYECKASIHAFVKSIDLINAGNLTSINRKNRGVSAQHKINYMLAIKNFFKQNIVDDGLNLSCEAFFATFGGDMPDYNVNPKFGVGSQIKVIKVSEFTSYLYP